MLNRSVVSASFVLFGCAGGSPSSSESATAPPRAPPAPVATRRSDGAVIAGAVHAADGKPIAGALVAAVPALAPIPREASVARSQRDGGFELGGLAPGRYALTATAAGAAAAYLAVVTVGEREVLSGRELVLGGKAITLRGAVSVSGLPASEGTLVRAVRESDVQGDVFVVECDERGAYEVMLPEAAGYTVTSGDLRFGRRVDGDRDAVVDLAVYPSARPAPAEVVDWLRRAAIPLAGAEAGRGLADLLPFRGIVGDARVVSLGEPTHGNHELNQIKHRILELLAYEHGFTMLGIEANFNETLAINRYVATGAGDPAEALGELAYWFHDNDELLELVRWMRRYNEDRTHPTKLAFYGIDIQSYFAEDALPVIDYLRAVDPVFAREAARRLAPLVHTFDKSSYAHLSPETQAAAATALAAIRERLDASKPVYVQRAGAASWAITRHHLRVLGQVEEVARDPRVLRYAIRDRAMADNVEALLELGGPSSRMVVWAHNSHINLDSNGGPGSWPSMGHYLEQRLGAHYVAVGLMFHRGSFRALKDGEYATVTPPSAPPGSFDATLARIGVPMLALDLRNAQPGTAPAAWLAAELSTQRSDAQESWTMVPLTARALYDAVVFAEQSTATHIRRTPPPTPSPPELVETLLNGGFEDGGPTPTGWSMPGPSVANGFRVGLSEDRPRAGKRSAVIERTRRARWAFGELTQRLDAAPFRGRRVRLRADVRADVTGAGSGAQLFMRVGGAASNQNTLVNARPLGLATMFERPVTARNWTRHSLEVDVPPEAKDITIRLVLTGHGRAWFDEVALEAVTR